MTSGNNHALERKIMLVGDRDITLPLVYALRMPHQHYNTAESALEIITCHKPLALILHEIIEGLRDATGKLINESRTRHPTLPIIVISDGTVDSSGNLIYPGEQIRKPADYIQQGATGILNLAKAPRKGSIVEYLVNKFYEITGTTRD